MGTTCIEVRPLKTPVALGGAASGGLLRRGPPATVGSGFKAHTLMACILCDGTCRIAAWDARSHALLEGGGDALDVFLASLPGGENMGRANVLAWVQVDLAHRRVQCKVPLYTADCVCLQDCRSHGKQ